MLSVIEKQHVISIHFCCIIINVLQLSYQFDNLFCYVEGGGGSFGRSGGDRYGSQSSGPDPTEGNWRSKPATEDTSGQSNYDDRRSGYFAPKFFC